MACRDASVYYLGLYRKNLQIVGKKLVIWNLPLSEAQWRKGCLGQCQYGALGQSPIDDSCPLEQGVHNLVKDCYGV